MLAQLVIPKSSSQVIKPSHQAKSSSQVIKPSHQAKSSSQVIKPATKPSDRASHAKR
ncbi:hypothetical protein ACROAC_18135 [Shewanella baltica]